MKIFTTFSAAPHRMMFFGGAVQIIVVMLFWMAELAGRHIGGWTAPVTVIPATWAHALLMLYTVFPFFMFGFLMTTYPRWMNGEVIPRGAYAGAFILLAAGVIGIYAGLFVSRALLAIGLLAWMAGWGRALVALFTVYRDAPAEDKHYETHLNAALVAGWAGIAVFLSAMLTDSHRLYVLSQAIGLWLFLVPVLTTVAHRMLPFFSGCVLPDYRAVQPAWSLPLTWVCVIGHVVADMADLSQWRFIFDLPLAGMAVYHAYHWGLHRSLSNRLLAVLHIAYAWLAVAMGLYGLQSLLAWGGDTTSLGRAPLHALGIGFITSMTLGMASRVTLGHSGRALELDRFTWWCFLGVGITALLRIVAELPAMSDHAYSLHLLTGLAWLACLGPWVWRYAPMTLRPRIDGKPG
jgi:uncharacterized protein involved in response to NO